MMRATAPLRDAYAAADTKSVDSATIYDMIDAAAHQRSFIAAPRVMRARYAAWR